MDTPTRSITILPYPYKKEPNAFCIRFLLHIIKMSIINEFKELLYLLNNTLIHLMYRLAQHRDVLRRVRADQDRLALLLVADQILAHLRDTLFVKTVEWLVKYQYLRIFHYRLCQTETLSHTETVLADVPSQVWIEADLLHTVAHFFLADLVIEPSKQLEVLVARVVGYKARRLNDNAHILREINIFSDTHTVHDDLAPRGLDEPADALHQHSFARAVTTYKAVYLPARKGDVYLFQDVGLSEGEVKIFYFDYI